MSETGDRINDLINFWAQDYEFYSKQGSIKSIDLSERTCVISPTDGGPDILDVYLEGDAGTATEKGFFVVPAAGSLVIATFTSKEEAFLSAYTEIDNVIAKQGEWVFNDGSNGGLITISDLVEKLNDLVTSVNAMYQEFKVHTHNVTAVGSPTGPAIPTPAEQNANSFDGGDFENELVKH